MIKKGAHFEWGTTQEQAFQKIKGILSSPQIMTMSIKGVPMILYMTSANRSIKALLVQTVEGLNAQYIIQAELFRVVRLTT